MFPLFSDAEEKRPQAPQSEKHNQNSSEHRLYHTAAGAGATIVCEGCGKEAVPLHLGCRLCEDCCDCRPSGT
jgi:hypothetical protein